MSLARFDLNDSKWCSSIWSIRSKVGHKFYQQNAWLYKWKSVTFITCIDVNKRACTLVMSVFKSDWWMRFLLCFVKLYSSFVYTVLCVSAGKRLLLSSRYCIPVSSAITISNLAFLYMSRRSFNFELAEKCSSLIVPCGQRSHRENHMVIDNNQTAILLLSLLNFLHV